MAVISVNSSQSLTNAVLSARDGDVIKLAPGTYSNIIIRDATFQNGITITSADPNNPAVLTDLTVRTSQGLTFSNLDLFNKFDKSLSFQFMQSSNLVFDGLTVSGSSSSGNAMDAQLMIVRESNNVTVVNSEFAHGWHGLNLFNTRFVKVENNFFHDLRTDGVRGGGNSDLQIKGNVFTDFYPYTNDHPDAIQLWTTNTSASAYNITIEANVVFRGDGNPTQGIFLRDVGGSRPFQNVVIANNAIVGGIYNGIAISSVNNGYLVDNIVQGFADQPSGIQMQNTSNVVVSGNTSSRYFGGLRGIEGQNGNVLIGWGTDGGVGIVNQWLSQNAEFITAWSVIDSSVLGEIHWNGAPGTPSGGGSYVPPTYTPPPTDTGDLDDDSANGGGSGTGSTDTGGSAPPPAGGSSGGTGTTIDGSSRDDRLIGSDSDDQLNGYGGNDVITGGGGNDVIRGGDGDDALHGNSGKDKIYGDAGGDNMLGYDGDDVLDGGAGRDTLDGGRGNDILTGGADNDIFRFRTFDINKGDHDVITDFQRGVDNIMITSAQFGAGGPGDQVFRFIGEAGFHGRAGEIRFFDAASGVTVQTDIDGDGLSDFEISLRGVHSISVKDFIL